MSHATETLSTIESSAESQSFAKRLAVLGYGLFSYGAGVTALLWIILAAGGLAPVSLSSFQAESTGTAIAVNLALIFIFALQHSIMARRWFKEKLTQAIPAAAERPTYMLMTGIIASAVLYFWQPVPGTIWSVENSIGQITLWTMYALGWSYLLISSFATNHFDLMGLRQVYLYFRKQPYTNLKFTQKFMYRYSRHPMMLGFFIGLWAVPVMTVSHFFMALLFTVYIFFGIFFEERDLLKSFGDTYRKYKKEIATFIPGIY